MPVKPVTRNNKNYSDMKRYTWIWIMLIALLSGCEDDFDRGGSNPGEGGNGRDDHFPPFYRGGAGDRYPGR